MNIAKIGHVISGIIAILFPVIAVLLVFSRTASGAGDDFFTRQQFDLPGTVLGAREADFNGDGKTDIVFLVDEPSGRRALYSFIQREAGRFPPVAGQILEVSPSMDLVQCLDLDGNGKAELYYVDRDGLWQYLHDGEQFSERAKSMITVPTLLAAAIEGRLLSQDCIYTLSGRPVAFVPVASGYSLWEYSQGKFKNIGTLTFSHLFSAAERPVKLFSDPSQESQGWFEVSIPAIVIGDSNGDDLDDVYLIWPDRLAIIPQNAAGRFDNAAGSVFRFQDRVEGNLCQATLVDFDRDGRLDVVCSHSAGGISGAETVINFFHSTQIRRRDRTENYSVKLTDACGNLIIEDKDGDGAPELIVPAVELGIMSTVKKMVTKKTDFHILIYPIDNLGRPAQDPKVRLKVSCRLDFEDADPTAHIRINWAGDYDGDGFDDLVVADGGGKLMFYQGEAEDYLQSRAELVLDMDEPDEIRPVQLNGDGRTDLIIIHAPADNATRITLLVTNRIG
jgi:hypothetical protein